MATPYWRLSGFYFFYFAFVGAFAPYWGLYLKSVALSALEIGILMSLLQVTRIFAPNVWGWVADHTGRRTLIIQLAAVASVISYLGVFAGDSFAWLFLVMALMSFFWSASLPLVEAITFGHLGDAAAAYGRIRLWGSVGFIVAVLGVGYLLDVLPIASLPWLVLATMLGIVAFSSRIPEARPIAGDADHLPIWQVMRRPEVAALIGACFLMAAAHGPYYTFFSIYLEERGYSKGLIGWLWAIGVIAEILVFIWMPRLFGRFRLSSILAVSFALAVARFLAIGWLVDMFWVVLLAQLAHAATFGAYHAAAVAMIHRFFRGRHQARGQALYTSLSFGAGGTVGGLYAGYAWDDLGPGVTFSIAAVCAAAGLALVLIRLRGAGGAPRTS